MISVSVYLFDKLDSLSGDFAERNIYRLPESRRDRCARYLREVDRQACVISYMLLRQGLYEKYRISEPVEFTYNDYSKPYLKDYPHIFFNLSHCEQGIACAIADFEVGIDIQDIHPYDPGVANMVCSAGELRLLAESSNPARLFCRMWTAKESYAKARGVGVADVLKFEPPEGAVTHREWENYIVALCAKKHSADELQIEWYDIIW